MYRYRKITEFGFRRMWRLNYADLGGCVIHLGWGPSPTRELEVDFWHAKTLRKTNLFAGKRPHFRLTCVAQKRLLWVFDQVLYWHLCIISISQQSLFFLLKGNNVGFIKCPDGGRCKNGQTCCYLASHRRYGCCDTPRAVCCTGKLDGMCCSHGFR